MKSKKSKKRNSEKSVVFKDICAQNRATAADRLARKARHANDIAKISSQPAQKRIAYATKHAALNQGLECDFFRARSDEQGRANLVQVADEAGRALHLPMKRLSTKSLERRKVRAVLGLDSRKVA